MKALCWTGVNKLAVETVDDPAILNDQDIIVRVALTTSCGSDLHLLGGYVPTMRAGDVLGRSGQCPVKRYNRRLRDLIAGGTATPSSVVIHELGLEDAPQAYEHFDNRDDGWTKVVLHPDFSSAA